MIIIAKTEELHILDEMMKREATLLLETIDNYGDFMSNKQEFDTITKVISAIENALQDNKEFKEDK